MTVVDRVANRKGTRAVAQGYLEFLYTDQGQEIVAKNFYRPRTGDVAARYARQFPRMILFTMFLITAFRSLSFETARPNRA